MRFSSLNGLVIAAYTLRPALHGKRAMKKNRRHNFSRSAPGRPEQLHLLPKDVRFFGGSLLHGKRRGRRPLSTKEPIHLVMRSSWAKGPNAFTQPRNKKVIEALCRTLAKKYGVRIYQRAIVSNHLHFVLRIHNRDTYKSFVRVLTGKIASHIMRGNSFSDFLGHVEGEGFSKSRAKLEIQGKGQRFWQFRPFSRVMTWGRDFRVACRYVIQNTLEAFGFIPYRSRLSLYPLVASDFELGPRL